MLGNGSTGLNISDQGTTSDQGFNVTSSEVDRLDPASGNSPDMAPVTYRSITNLALHAGTGNNVFYLQSTAAGTTTDVYGGASAKTDEFGVSNPGVRLDDIQGPLRLHGLNGPGTGLGGESFSLVNDSLTASVQTYTLTAGTLNRSGMASITYDHLVENILYTSELAGAVINIQSNAASDYTVLALDGSGDQVTLGSLAPGLGGNLAGIQGTIGLQGDLTASIVVDDSGDTTARPQAALSTGPAPYDYQLNGLAPGTLLFRMDPATPVSILGGSGNDTFTVASSLSDSGIRIVGGSGTNTLVGPSAANNWAITGQNRGTLNTVAFSNFQNLVGSSVSDAFRFSAGQGVTGTIKGGTGAGTLDYSLYTTRVNVNLGDGTNGTATGVGGTVTGITALIGGSSNDKLNAGSVSNVRLTGGLGTNSLSGTGTGDSVVESIASSYTLVDAKLTGTGAGFTDNLSGITSASLIGISTTSNAFTVSGWTGTGSLSAPAGTGTVTARKGAQLHPVELHALLQRWHDARIERNHDGQLDRHGRR